MQAGLGFSHPAIRYFKSRSTNKPTASSRALYLVFLDSPPDQAPLGHLEDQKGYPEFQLGEH